MVRVTVGLYLEFVLELELGLYLEFVRTINDFFFFFHVKKILTKISQLCLT